MLRPRDSLVSRFGPRFEQICDRTGVCGAPRSGGARVTRTEFVSRQEGQTMAEYAVVLGVITPLLVIALAALSDSVAERLNAVVGFLS
jgi:Flp pilus assembly pilin Flp